MRARLARKSGDLVTTIGTYRVFDEIIRIDTHRSLAPTLRESLVDLRADGRADNTIRTRLRRGGSWQIRHRDGSARPTTTEVASSDLALYATLRAINVSAARQAGGTGIALHASAIEVDGRVVAFAGRSSAGKSTVAAVLALGGHGYVADEVVAVDATGHVRPYHRPVGLRRGGVVVAGVQVPDGPFIDTYPLPLGDRARLSPGGTLACIVIVERHDGEVAVEAVDESEALFHLSGMTLGSAGHERRAFRRLETLVRAVPVRRLRYADATTVLGVVGDLAAL